MPRFVYENILIAPYKFYFEFLLSKLRRQHYLEPAERISLDSNHIKPNLRSFNLH